ncbi:hypothetical protein BLNAU_8176 [Blattamonas nauphoetae]|uniref:Uncharacterized protein n=1 Tax=Blattamonas nauphoetae TaxID=2049346 RepID=A0ABQ9XZL4_9EUKA|nr:hypothetical protein BLNAU_8176 [Blattamonas nauphoetae]
MTETDPSSTLPANVQESETEILPVSPPENQTQFIFEKDDPNTRRVDHPAYKYEFGEGTQNVNGIWIWTKNQFTHTQREVALGHLDNKKKKFIQKYGSIHSMKPDKKAVIEGSCRCEWVVKRGGQTLKAFVTGIRKGVIKKKESQIFKT